MKILSVNVGQEKAIGSKSGTTGIYKEPKTEHVYVGELGLQDDVIVDTENHGGVDQAVYIYGLPDYDWWSEQLGKTLAPGIFGENLTLSELESASICIGDRLKIGDVLLEVTSPRIPCVTLATRMDDPKFVKKFVQAERYGAYCRVLQTGYVQAGNLVETIPYDGIRVEINEVAQAFYAKSLTNEQIRRLLAVPIADRARRHYSEQLS